MVEGGRGRGVLERDIFFRVLSSFYLNSVDLISFFLSFFRPFSFLDVCFSCVFLSFRNGIFIFFFRG